MGNKRRAATEYPKIEIKEINSPPSFGMRVKHGLRVARLCDGSGLKSQRNEIVETAPAGGAR